MKNTILKSFLVAMLAVLCFVTSCKKEQEIPAPQLQAKNTKAPAVITHSFTGPNWVVPPGAPGAWGDVYFNFATNTSGTTSAVPRLKFSEQFNSAIFTGNGIQLYYKDIAGTNLASITSADFSGATPVSTKLGQNTASVIGWYTYVGRTAVPVPNRYVFAQVTATGALYVLQLDSVVPFQNPLNPAQYKVNPLTFKWAAL